MLDIIAYAPQPERFTGIVKCVWSVISLTLWSRSALEVLKGVIAPAPASELAVMSHWRSAGLHAWMDLDHPVDILQVPKGFRARAQFIDGIRERHTRSCAGRFHQIWHKPYETAWGCNKCKYSVRFGPGARTIEKLKGREQDWEANSKYFRFTPEPEIEYTIINGQTFRERSLEAAGVG
jgi:hypothetical protein